VLALPDEDDLIRRAQNGDVHAFETLVQAHIPRVRRFARSFAPSDADADDLAQEALLKLYRSLKSYRFESSFSTWLYRVIKNAFMDGHRRATALERAARAAGNGLMETHSTGPDELLLRAEERERLWAAIGAVAAEFRAVLVLCDVEGMSISEVAAIEKLPEGTVKSRLHRARAHMARLLREKEMTGNSPGFPSVQPGVSVDKQ